LEYINNWHSWIVRFQQPLQLAFEPYFDLPLWQWITLLNTTHPIHINTHETFPSWYFSIRPVHHGYSNLQGCGQSMQEVATWGWNGVWLYNY
jgi:hypothetical protein